MSKRSKRRFQGTNPPRPGYNGLKFDVIPLGEPTELAESYCPQCGELLQAASQLKEHGTALPQPGCPVICGYCGEVLVFDANMKQVRPTAEQLVVFATYPGWDELERVRKKIRAAIVVRYPSRPQQRPVQ